MPIYRINDFPDGSGSLTSDDIFLFMDDPAGGGTTKKISLSQISSAIGGGGGDLNSYFNTSLVAGSGISFVYSSGDNSLTINSNNVEGSNLFNQNLNTSDSPLFNNITISGSQIIGGGANSGDGNGYGTLELIPDSGLYNNDQYLIVDPTAPNHIHLRAGGDIDNSNAELIVGGENTNVKIGAGTNPEIIIKTAGYYSVEFLGQIDNGFGDESGATLHVTSIINGTIVDGMTIYGEGLPVEGWVLQFGTVMAPQGSGGIGNYYLPGANYLIGSQSFNSGNSTNNTWTFGNDSNLSVPGNILLDNGTSVAVGTYNNGTGGNGGISLNCAVGYELNWQGGHLRSSEIGNSSTTHPLFVDSPIQIPGSGSNYMTVDSTGITFPDGSTQTSASSGGGGNSTTVVPLTFNATLNTNASSGDIFDVTLTDNATLANPTNPVNGKTIRWRVTQDNNGNHTVTLGNKFNIPSSASSTLPWSTSPNKMDILAATYHQGRDKWDVVAFVPGY